MAIVREGVSLFETQVSDTSPFTTMAESHTVQSGTTLLVLCICMDANIDVTVTPFFNTSETMTLIHQTTSSGNSADTHCYTYGLVNPTATTADIEYTVDSTDELFHAAINYSGTISTSVAAATNYLAEDVNDAATATTVIGSVGTTGATLLFTGVYHGADGDPASNATSFTEIADGDAFDTGAGIAYYVAELIGGAPEAITVTWAAGSDENAGQMIELLPATVASAFPYSHYQMLNRQAGIL